MYSRNCLDKNHIQEKAYRHFIFWDLDNGNVHYFESMNVRIVSFKFYLEITIWPLAAKLAIILTS